MSGNQTLNCDSCYFTFMSVLLQHAKCQLEVFFCLLSFSVSVVTTSVYSDIVNCDPPSLTTKKLIRSELISRDQNTTLILLIRTHSLSENVKHYILHTPIFTLLPFKFLTLLKKELYFLALPVKKNKVKTILIVPQVDNVRA